MKKFTKFMLSVAAVTAVSATMAVAAMAADTVTGTYDPATGNVALDGVVSSGDQQTLLVLTEDADTVTEAIIAQIDQDASISSFVLPASLTEGTYYIRIGGTDGTIQKGTLTISGGGDVQSVTIIVGDANLDNTIDSSDVGYVLRYSNNLRTKIGKAGETKTKVDDSSTIIVGDANLDSTIDSSDVGYVLRYSNNLRTKIGKAGTEISVVSAE